MCVGSLPEPYVTWFAQKGFPEGELGQMLHILHEVQSNGLEYLFKRLR
ncbi:MAG: putative quorum-sensing-regulated virulence factor [Candidatus Anammoxibacter sp.]